MESTNEKMFYDFLTQEGVYSKIKDLTENDFYQIFDYDFCKSLDLYCPHCNADKTFVRKNNDSNPLLGEIKIGNGRATNRCNRLLSIFYSCPTCGQRLYYTLFYKDNAVIKLAQYPSLYDMSRDDLKKYKNNDYIEKEEFEQIYKADTCASTGYSIGAFAYMRRVYEAMMLSVFQQHKDELNISFDEFKKMGGNEKIEKIRNYLAIDESIYAPLYSILSGGIHTYTEDECSSYYSFLKLVLLDILREQKAKKERDSNRKAILDLHSKLKAQDK